jgi:hypothetical protein
MARLPVGAFALTTCFLATSANAGRSCEEAAMSASTMQRAVELARVTRDRLDASGAEAVLIGRAGQDLTRWGLRYSHFGFAWRDHPKGRWLVVHQLNHCRTDRSELFDEGLANFFMDDLWKMEAVVLVPGAQVQRRIAGVLASRRHLDFHEPRYNLVAYPFATRYQNSNQWALEVLAAALAKDAHLEGREAAQQELRRTGYQPTQLRLDTFTRLGARMARANVAFDDHPGELRWSGRIRTVSVESAFAYVEARDRGVQRFEVHPNQSERP